MKKFIVFIITAIILAVATSFTALSSNYETKYRWVKIENKGDELKGIEPYTAYMLMSKTESETDVLIDWHLEGVSIVPSKNFIVVSLKKGIFDAQTALIGFYDNDGNLISKTTSAFNDIDTEGSITNEEIIDFITNKDGKVRVVIDKYRDADYDVYIPSFSNSTIISKDEFLKR